MKQTTPTRTDATPSGDASRRRFPEIRWVMVAALVYLGISLWALGDVLPQATTHLLLQPDHESNRWPYRPDQEIVLATVTRNARALTGSPSRLLGPGPCYPFERPHTLGEHMLGTSLLAALPYWVSDSPILGYNLALALTFWIAALAMYGLAYHFTQDTGAAFIAGLLFSYTQIRLQDPAHPFVNGDLWLPLVLLFLHRTFTRRTWLDALGLATFLVLTLGESLYVLLAGSLLAAVYVAPLLIRYGRALQALTRVAFATTVFVAAAALLLRPYLEASERWDILGGRQPILVTLGYYTPGNIGFPGVAGCALAAIGLLDRARRRHPCPEGEDPRITVALAGLLVVWCSVWAIPLGDLGSLPSPLLPAGELFPPLRSVRAPYKVGIGLSLVIAFLAAYGVKFLLGGTRRPLRIVFVLGWAAFILAERFVPQFSRWSSGTIFDLIPHRFAPPDDDVALLARMPRGAVADVPTGNRKAFLQNSHALLLSAYHGRPTSACYNSFLPATLDQTAQLTWQSAHKEAREALAALGFGSILVHKHRFAEKRLAFLRAAFEKGVAEGELRRVGESSGHLAYALRATQTATSFRLLQARGEAPVISVSGNAAVLPMVVTNRGPFAFRHPDPIAPSEVVLRWHRGLVGRIFRSRSRVLLPLALGRRGSLEIAVATELPPTPGTYRVDLARASEPWLVIARRFVEVLPSVERGDACPDGERTGVRPCQPSHRQGSPRSLVRAAG